MKRPCLAILALGAAVVPWSAAPAAGAPAPKLTVMSRNIYLGGDIAKPVGARDRADFEARVAALFSDVRRTDFAARAKLLAREIDRYDPDLVGLQEVSTYLRGPAGVKDGAATPSREVVFDFQRLLMRAIAARKLRYRAVSADRGTDIEAPSADGHDLRFKIHNVVLVKRRKGLKIRKRSNRTFKEAISLPTQGGTFTVNRGWAAVDASLAGRRFRFVDTHLEAFLAGTRNKQASELASRSGPLRGRGRTILVGDLNSDPRAEAEADRTAYRTVLGAGLTDVVRGRRNTCCHAEDLRNAAPTFDKRIDHIFARGARPLSSRVIGRERNNRTKSGLWPSDHGGVVATLRLR